MRKNEVKCVIFDLDGTLLDTIEDLTDSMNYALQKHGFPAHRSEECMKMVGNGKRNFVLEALPAGKGEYANDVLRVSREHYQDNCLNKTRPYEGINEILEYCRGNDILTAVMTNKDEGAAVEIVEHYFGEMIGITIGAVEWRALKPDPEAVLEIIEKFGLSKSECVFVGDSDVDVMTGKAAGVFTIAVSWGFREIEILEQCDPDVIVDKPIELLDLIRDSNQIKT